MKARTVLAILSCSALCACAGDETLTAYGVSGQTWQLSEIDGAPFDPPATLSFPEAASFAGRAPCNSFTGDITVPYPWFDTGPIAATRALCPDQVAEDAFFSALDAMTLAEVAGDTLILSDDGGRSMIFKAVD